MRAPVEEKTALDKRLANIEKQNKRLKLGMLALALLLVPLFLLGAKPGPHDGQFGQIIAKGITIQDGSGNALIKIGSDKEEGIGISIFNTKGKRIMSMGVSVDEKGSGIMVSDTAGRPRIGLGMDQGIPGIALVDEKGTKIIAMGGDANGYGLMVNDSMEVKRVGLGYKDGNAGIMLYDEKGEYVRGLIRQKDGLNYSSYFDKNGKEIFE